eukprot:5459747-Pyramimonas_sp.AAC.1
MRRGHALVGWDAVRQAAYAVCAYSMHVRRLAHRTQPDDGAVWDVALCPCGHSGTVGGLGGESGTFRRPAA